MGDYSFCIYSEVKLNFKEKIVVMSFKVTV